MALTDGNYIARLRLRKLDRVYQPGETVPGSAFTGNEQVVEYIRRGWVDVDSVESTNNISLAPGGETVQFEVAGSTNSSGVMRPTTANISIQSAFMEGDGPDWNNWIAAPVTLDELPFDWIGPRAQPELNYGMCTVAPGLYLFRINVSVNNLRFLQWEISGQVLPTWQPQKFIASAGGASDIEAERILPVYQDYADIVMTLTLRDANRLPLQSVTPGSPPRILITKLI